MIPVELAQTLHEAFERTDEMYRQLKFIVQKMEDDTPVYYAHATLLDQLHDVVGKLEDIDVAAEALIRKPNRP